MLGRELTELDDMAQHQARPRSEHRARRDAASSRDGLGRAGSIEPFDLDLHAGEVVGLAGLLGSGRTEMASLLFGIDRAGRGLAQHRRRSRSRATRPIGSIERGVALCPEDRKAEGIVDDLTVRENIILAVQAGRGWLRSPERRPSRRRSPTSTSSCCTSRRPIADQPVKNLSGGNQQKVILARWLATNPQLLILDEPTRGIDVGTKADIQQLVLVLAEEGKSCVFISSELDEVLRTSHRIVVLRDRTKVTEFAGEVDEASDHAGHRRGGHDEPSLTSARLARRFGESRLLFPLVVLGRDPAVRPDLRPRVLLRCRSATATSTATSIDILRNGATVMLLALGMTLVIATGGVDLSVGAVMAISASVAAILIDPDLQSPGRRIPNFSATPLPVVIVVTLLVAPLCGLWNGVLVAYGGHPADGRDADPDDRRPRHRPADHQRRPDPDLLRAVRVPRQRLGHPLPFSLFIVAVVFIGAWLLTRRTALGLFIESVGINARSSFFSGINEKRVKLFAYMFCGFCAGIAGLVASSNIRTSDANNIGLNFELDAILAVVIGGTALGAGGRFSLLASVLGALVIQAITTSMYAIGVPANAMLAIKGVVVILVILLFSEQVRDCGPRRVARPKPACGA